MTLTERERDVAEMIHALTDAFLALGDHREHEVEDFLCAVQEAEDVLRRRTRAYSPFLARAATPGDPKYTYVYDQITLRQETVRSHVRVNTQMLEDYPSAWGEVILEAQAQIAAFPTEKESQIRLHATWRDGLRDEIYQFLGRHRLYKVARWCRKRWPVEMTTYEVQTYLPAMSLVLPAKDKIAAFTCVRKVE